MSSSDSEPEEVSSSAAALQASEKELQEREGRRHMTRKKRGKREHVKVSETPTSNTSPQKPNEEGTVGELDDEMLDILAAETPETTEETDSEKRVERKRIRVEPTVRRKRLLVSVSNMSGVTADVGVDEKAKAFADSLFRNPKHERVRASIAGAQKGKKLAGSKLFNRKGR